MRGACRECDGGVRAAQRFTETPARVKAAHEMFVRLRTSKFSEPEKVGGKGLEPLTLSV